MDMFSKHFIRGIGEGLKNLAGHPDDKMAIMPFFLKGDLQ
jgi:hypothetical protein